MGFPVGFASTTVVAELLELAAADQVTRFRLTAERDPAAVHFSGAWYGRCPLSSRMTLLRRTPLMIAASFGSLNVLHLILSLNADVDARCGPEAVTALHCAAAGGAPTASLAASLLLLAGADPSALDASGRRPFDLIPSSPFLSPLRSSLQSVLGNGICSPPATPSSDSSTSSPQERRNRNPPTDASSGPDMSSSFYASDEFRMFGFKIQACSRAYSHDWTECPFLHPGENARRRDPRMYNYGCTPCVEFRRGLCAKGDLCEYAHGVFECWLHPAQYRTRLCKDGESCSRRVCFFAHSADDLRALPPSDGSMVASPRILVRSPRSGEVGLRGVSSPRALNALRGVSSPRWIAQSSLLCSEKEELELRLRLRQQQQMRSAFSSNLKQELVGIEPDLSWVQSLVGENEIGKGGFLGDGKALGSAMDEEHAILGAWLEQMKLDQKVVW